MAKTSRASGNRRRNVRNSAAKAAPSRRRTSAARPSRLQQMRENMMNARRKGANRGSSRPVSRRATGNRGLNTSVSRRDFLRTSGLAAAGVGAAALGASGVAHAQTPPEPVYFPGTPPDPVYSDLLAAIEAAGVGGTIIVQEGEWELPPTGDTYGTYELLEGQTIKGDGVVDAEGVPKSKLIFNGPYGPPYGVGLSVIANNNTIEGLSIKGSSSGIFVPVLVQGDTGLATNVKIKDNHINAPATSSLSSAIYVNKAMHSVVSGNVIDSSRRGITVAATPEPVACNNITVTDNTIQAGNFGVYMTGTGNNDEVTRLTFSNTVSGNSIDMEGGRGVFMGWADENTVTGNTIISQDGICGIRLRDGNSNMLTDNTINGTYRQGIRLRSRKFNSGMPSTTYNTIRGNNLSGVTATGAQVWVDTFSHNNILKNNDYGPVDLNSGIAGAWIEGNNNTLTNENFCGDYPGWTYNTQGNPVGPGCILLDADYPILVNDPNDEYDCANAFFESQNNTITALKNGQVINGFTLCTQIADMPWEFCEKELNVIPGLPRCDHIPLARLEEIKARIEAHKAWMEQNEPPYGSSPEEWPSE
jgi:parallel beta-helix repeat protein